MTQDNGDLADAAVCVAKTGTMMFRRSDVLGRLKRHQALYRDALRTAEAEGNHEWRENALTKLRIVNALSNDILDRCPIFNNPAQAIEARRAEIGTGSVHESAAPQGWAPTSSSSIRGN